MTFLRAFELLANAIFRERNKKPPAHTPFAIYFRFQHLLSKIKITASILFGGNGE